MITETTQAMIRAQPAAASAFDWKSIGQGAATTIWAGLVAPAAAIGGSCCEDCHVAEIDDTETARIGVRSYALDPARADLLWSRTNRWVDERF